MNTSPEPPSILRLITNYGLAVVIVVVVVGSVTAFVYATDIFLILFLAILFGIFLNRVSAWLAGHAPIGYGGSLAAVTATLILLLVVGLVTLGARVDSEVSDANLHIGKAKQQIQAAAKRYPSLRSVISSTPFINDLLLPDASSSSDDSQQSQEANSPQEASQGTADAAGKLSLPAGVTQYGSQVVAGAFQTTFGLVVNSLLIFFVGLFLAVSPAGYRDGVVVLFPPDHRQRAREVLNQIGDTLWNWLLGRFASMLITGGGAGLILFVLGVPMAGALGVLTGLLTFVPNIGGLIALILAMLFALPQGGTVVLMVLGGYIVLQLIESYVITPLIQQHQVSLPPALLICFQAVMGVIFGLLGAAVASPLLAALKVLVEEVYIHDVLENGDCDSDSQPA